MMADYEELTSIEQTKLQEHAWLQRILKKLDETSAREDMKEVDRTIEAREKYKLSILAGKTPEQVDAYIDEHVIDLKSVREFLKKLSRVLLVLVKSEWGA